MFDDPPITSTISIDEDHDLILLLLAMIIIVASSLLYTI